MLGYTHREQSIVETRRANTAIFSATFRPFVSTQTRLLMHQKHQHWRSHSMIVIVVNVVPSDWTHSRHIESNETYFCVGYFCQNSDIVQVAQMTTKPSHANTLAGEFRDEIQ